MCGYNFIPIWLHIFSVKEFSTGLTTSAFAGYGIRFDPNDSTHYILFSDVNDNNHFDGPTTCLKNDTETECVQKYVLTRGSHIESICAGSDKDHCYKTNNSPDLDQSLGIVFKRPNPDAKIYIGSSGDLNNYAEIIISSANGETKNVVVTALGDIYVKK